MTKIIAEVGSNFETQEHCIRSIELAARAGADAVKFQLFDDVKMYGFETGDNLAQYSIRPNWIPSLWQAAQDSNIEFMCSFFSPEDVKTYDRYVSRHKVASSDMLNVPLIQEMANTNKPIIISTGGHFFEEVKLVDGLLGDIPDITYLYCESAYPCNSTNILKMAALHTLGRPVGLSDHSTEVLSVPQFAVYAWNAAFIEKHVNLVGVKNRPDAAHAISFEDLSLMVSSLRNLKGFIGKDGGLEVPEIFSPEEADMRFKHNRRFMAISNISKGDKLVYGHNFGLFRSKSLEESSEYLDYTSLHEIDGQITWRDIPKGEPLSRGFLSEHTS